MFNSRFLNDSIEPEESFDELFSEVPGNLARHNQIGNSSKEETSSGNTTPNKQVLLGNMADQQPAAVQAPVTVKQMPSSRHHTALKFSEDQPCELRRFFEELGNLFGPANITTDVDMKEQAVRYIEVDTADMWKSLAEYSNPQSSYEDWKKKVVGLYPGANEDKRWTMKDLDKLVGERAWIGIYNMGDFGAYY